MKQITLHIADIIEQELGIANFASREKIEELAEVLITEVDDYRKEEYQARRDR